MKHRLLIILAASLLPALIGCSGGGGNGSTDAPDPATGATAAAQQPQLASCYRDSELLEVGAGRDTPALDTVTESSDGAVAPDSGLNNDACPRT